ncbi:LuxR family transcriptional regulator [Acidobacteriota bacterium]
MSHFIIFILVLNLVAGMAVILYVLAALRRYRRPFLKTLLAYILSFNGLVIVYFCYQYVLTNVFRSDVGRIVEYNALFTVLLILVYCAEFGIAFSLFRLVKHLKGRKISGTAKGLFVSWVLLFGAASAYGLVLFFQKMQWLAFYWIHAGWIFSLNLIILPLLISTLTGNSRGGVKKNSLRSFAWIFLAGYAAFFFSHLDFYFLHTGVQRFYDPVVLLIINLCPLLWLRFYFEKENRVPGMTESDEERLIRFCEKYGISNRERDIIQQVMIGKSNKEIEEILFISFNTVKNHLYSVYKKIGATSRSELIHRINRFEE